MLGSIDPESTKGKLFLLIIDKLFIGAILAVAFMVYDLWKTEEVRQYNQIIQRTQDEFKRAEFTKELLPIVLDTKQRVSTRIEVLGSLIRTRSIDENSAVMIALSFLREGKFVSADRGHVDDQLVDSFVRMLSPIIPTVLPQILDAYSYYPSIRDAPPGYASGLIEAFEYAWKNHPEDQLSILSDKEFVAENFDKLIAITPQAHIQQESWTKTSLLALQILRDIEIVESARKENDTVIRARSRLAKIINPTVGDAASIRLSTSLLYALRSSAVFDASFIEAAFLIIVQPEKVSENFDRIQPNEKRNPFYHQLSAAESYITSASTVNPKGEVLAKPVVRDFLNVLRVGSISYGNYPIERMAVCVLVRSMSSTGPDNQRSDEAEELLRLLSELPEDTLRAANIGFLSFDWGDPDDELRAMQHCGMNLPGE